MEIRYFNTCWWSVLFFRWWWAWHHAILIQVLSVDQRVLEEHLNRKILILRMFWIFGKCTELLKINSANCTFKHSTKILCRNSIKCWKLLCSMIVFCCKSNITFVMKIANTNNNDHTMESVLSGDNVQSGFACRRCSG